MRAVLTTARPARRNPPPFDSAGLGLAEQLALAVQLSPEQVAVPMMSRLDGLNVTSRFEAYQEAASAAELAT
jgi:hypothetical protein